MNKSKRAIYKCFVSLLFLGATAGAEHTVYVPPVFAQGSFFQGTLRDEETVGSSLAWHHEQSLNPTALGRYLGPDNKADFTIGPRFDADLYTSLLMHSGPVGNDFERQSVMLRPTVRLHMLQGTVWTKLFPFCDEENVWGVFGGLNVGAVEQKLNTFWFPIQDKRVGTEEDFQDYFEGGYENHRPRIEQAKLNKAKFYPGHQVSRGPSSLSVGIINQHRFLTDGYWQLQGTMTIPLGEKEEMDFLFAPRRSMGRHVGIGAAANIILPLKKGIQLNFGLQDTYWVAEHEMRTVGIKWRPFSYYLNLARRGQVDEPVLPAANILTQRCLVSPGHATAVLAKIEGSFLDGHKAFISWEGRYKDQERIQLTQDFTERTYSVPAGSYDTTHEFNPHTLGAVLPIGALTYYERFDLVDPGFGYDMGPKVWLTPDTLDLEVAGTPSYFEQVCDLGWGYERHFKKWNANSGFQLKVGCRLPVGENSKILPYFFRSEVGFFFRFL